MIKIIKEFLFGKVIEGEKLHEPNKKPERTFTMDELSSWVNEFRFGNRYGHRGTFYQN